MDPYAILGIRIKVCPHCDADLSKKPVIVNNGVPITYTDDPAEETEFPATAVFEKITAECSACRGNLVDSIYAIVHDPLD